MSPNGKLNFLFCGNKKSFQETGWGPGIRKTYIIHYCVSGKGYFKRKNKTHTVEEGMSFLIRPWEEILYYPDEKEPWEYSWIEFEGKEYAELIESIAFFEDDCIMGRLSHEKILPLFDAFSKILESGDCRNTALGLCTSIIGAYADAFGERDNDAGELSYFESARKIIKSHYHLHGFGVGDICKALSISRSTLHRAFKSACGSSPGDYLINYRIETAKALLSAGASAKIAGISSGFENQLYFSKAFSRHTGMAPSEFKKRRQAD